MRTYNPESGSEWSTSVDAWLVHLETWGRLPSTLVQYGTELRRFAAWADGVGLTPNTVRRVDIEDYIVWIRADRSLGGRSIAARLSALRNFFSWLVRREHRNDDPTLGIENPRFRKPLPSVLSPDQLDVLLDLPLRRTDGPVARRDAALLRTLAWTGVRLSECAALDWDHFDLTKGAATVTVIDGNGGRDRVVPVPDGLPESLLAYLELRMPLGTHRWAWHSNHGGRLGSRGIATIVSNYGARLGVQLSPHRLRAQCGVDLVRTGASLPQIRAVLGHEGYDTLVPCLERNAEQQHLVGFVQCPETRDAGELSPEFFGLASACGLAQCRGPTPGTV